MAGTQKDKMTAKKGQVVRKPQGGRPTKQTEALVNKLEYAFSLGCTVTEACLYANISRETYYKWCKLDDSLNDRMTQLRESPVLLARESVVRGMKDDPDLALKFLERRKRKEFSLRSEVDEKSDRKLTIEVVNYGH